MLANNFYYTLKPFIPLSLRIALRKRIVLKKRMRSAHLWPIEPKAGEIPEGWQGWPGGKRFALVLTHDVEGAQGVKRCLALAEMEKSLGFRSVFNFVAEDYHLDAGLFSYLREKNFEIGVHGLNHNGNLFQSKEGFLKKVPRINQYLKKWNAVGFRAPSMYHNLEWISHLNIEYDMSTFDTDPFEPQPDGVETIFPFWCSYNGHPGYVELPYTLPQDHTLFVLMEERGIDIWKKKLDWIVENGGMALLITHPDYMNNEKGGFGKGEYPIILYSEFLEYLLDTFKGQYWNPLPKEAARFWKEKNGTMKSSNVRSI